MRPYAFTFAVDRHPEPHEGYLLAGLVFANLINICGISQAFVSDFRMRWGVSRRLLDGNVYLLILCLYNRYISNASIHGDYSNCKARPSFYHRTGFVSDYSNAC